MAPSLKTIAKAELAILNTEHCMLALSRFNCTHSLTPFRIGLLCCLFRLGRSSAATLTSAFPGGKDDSTYRMALHGMRKQGYVNQHISAENSKDVTYSLTEKGLQALHSFFADLV